MASLSTSIECVLFDLDGTLIDTADDFQQVLDNDEANAQTKLEAYTVVDATLRWVARASAARGGELSLFVEARNLFDRRYATRGIYAFDSATGGFAVFLTPAPGRRLMSGVEWRF